jgi:hypothetical protein
MASGGMVDQFYALVYMRGESEVDGKPRNASSVPVERSASKRLR